MVLFEVCWLAHTSRHKYFIISFYYWNVAANIPLTYIRCYFVGQIIYDFPRWNTKQHLNSTALIYTFAKNFATFSFMKITVFYV